MRLKRAASVLLCLLLTAACAAAEKDPVSVTELKLRQKMKYSDVKEQLSQYPNLKKAEMYNTPVTAAQADELAALYPGVEFGWTLKIGTDHMVRTDAEAFSTLHRSGAKGHSTKELSVLRYCKKLKALDIGHNNVDDISWIAELPDLRVLIIAINKVTDLSPLAGLKKLEYLEVFSNRVTDISPLKELTRLMDLNIGYNRIEDFTPLYGMTQLKRLWLFRAANRGIPGVPKDVTETLKEKLPQTQINWKAEPTLGGWREHPHYDVIHEMFQGTYYIPFTDSFPDGEGQP